ncbi:MAG: ribonuclease Z, partial [Candidatus Omnitrophica bacterium]|nr:ribonuclease Z [Candidatus Omnitrophota bacterium]
SDLLITECSYRTGQRDDSWPHLNPEMAAGVAKEARVRRLILAHFDSGVYLTNKDRILAQKAARKIFKNTLAAKDGLRLIL